MPVPATILQLLQSNNINYALTPTDPGPTTDQTVCQVRSQLLADQHGWIQVLLPQKDLLDLELLSQELGRTLNPVTSAELNALLLKHNLQSVPAMPAWQGLPTLVDINILRYENVCLNSGDQAELVCVQRADFKALIRESSTCTLSSPTQTINSEPRNDEQQIVKSVSLFTQRRIKQRLQETLEIPPLHDTASKIIRLRANPHADISDLAKIIEFDPSLAAQVVSWAASPYYSAPGKIKSVQDAIVRVLGFDMVINLSLGLSLGRAFNPNVISKAQSREYWKNAVFMAAAIEALVTSIPRINRPAFGMSYLVGLLHNFGYLILAEVFPPHFQNINRHLEANPHLASGVVEQHVLGLASCQITAWLLEYWNLPPEVYTGIRQQFNPDYQGEHAAYAHLVYVANHLLHQHGTGNKTSEQLPQELFDSLYLSRDAADEAICNLLNSADDLKSLARCLEG
ncbi:MAG TPA: HDOD domain-containing protein [Cellvibrionaceae bacterium]